MSPRRESKLTRSGPSTYRYTTASRPNQPTVGTEPLMSDEERSPRPFHVDRHEITRPVLAWDRQGRTSRMEGDLAADSTHTFAGVPLYTQEKINPLAMIEQLRKPDAAAPLNLFDDFNGLPPKQTRGSSTNTPATGRTASSTVTAPKSCNPSSPAMDSPAESRWSTSTPRTASRSDPTS